MKLTPYYKTLYGEAYLGDAREILPKLALDKKVNLIMTSPPFALLRKKNYGNVEAEEYVSWFLDFARIFHTLLTDDGSLVIDIGGSWTPGFPLRSLYHYELLLQLCRIPSYRFYLAQEFFWYNPARLPTPAEWVTVRRERVKDAVNCIWWLCKSEHPKANNRHVLKAYSESMQQLLKKGYKAKLRPSGHDISTKFQKNNNGAIPPNLLEIANTESNSQYLKLCRAANINPHPARYPARLPEFFIKFLTENDNLVLDPFAGSNVTGEVAEKLGRRWMAIDTCEDYLIGSQFRFDELSLVQKNDLQMAIGVMDKKKRYKAKKEMKKGYKRRKKTNATR